MTNELPPLPDPYWSEITQSFTAEQMQEYARAAIAQAESRVDALQGAVDWLLQVDGDHFGAASVQRAFRIGYNRANRLCETAKERAAHGIKGGEQ